MSNYEQTRRLTGRAPAFFAATFSLLSFSLTLAIRSSISLFRISVAARRC